MQPVAACISPWRAAGGSPRYNMTQPKQPWMRWIRICIAVVQVVLSHDLPWSRNWILSFSISLQVDNESNDVRQGLLLLVLLSLAIFLHPEQNATHLYSHAAAFARTPLSLCQCLSGHSTTSLCCAHIDLTLLWGDSQLQKQVARSRCISLVHPIGPTVTTDSDADKVPLEGWKGHQH